MATVIQPQYPDQNHVHVHERDRERDRVQVDQVRPQQHSIMEDVSDSGDEEESFEGEMDEDQDRFYHSQAQQALYYQQHRQQHAEASGQNRHLEQDYDHEQQQGHERDEDEEMYSDDESSTASIPDENIDFSLTYALHTFLATVEGQASVVKGDSLLLLDDANSYWWLVRVLKTEDVGYIPAENIETPYERLARLNKHRNVDLAAATTQEKAAGAVRDREKLKGAIAGKAKEKRAATSGDGDEPAGRRVIFAPPTYVDHPGVTWSSDESDEEDEGEVEVTEVEEEVSQDDMEMEPDDGVGWADGAAQEQQNRIIEATTTATTPTPTPTTTITPKSNNPFAPRQDRKPESTIDTNPSTSPTTASTPIITVAPAVASPTTPQSAKLDPASVTETRRITATPTVAQGVLLPSAIVPQPRKVSTASTASITSTISAGSARSSTPTSPQEEKDKKKMRKGSKDDLKDGEKKKKGGVLSGLFSRKNKKDKGISSTDARSSEESIAVDAASPSRFSDDSGRAPTPQQSAAAAMQVSPGVSAHGLRLQQREQAAQMAYATKYLSKPDAHSPTVSEAAAAVAQSAAAMRLASMSGMSAPRPSSIIVSPNPAAPLLNVIRIFAGEHVKSEASFKTALINETTSSTDLIRQAVQRFHVAGDQADFVLTIKDVNGEEMELLPEEKPLVAFQEAVQQWSDDRELLPTVKRSSITSISSLASLSSHPAIQKLGMDFSDDSAVKIYLHRKSMAQSASIASQLSTVQESPENKSAEWSDPSQATGSDANVAAPPGPRYNPSLTVNTTAQASPERFSSPSARFTLQLLIHPADLPDGSILDPSSDAIIPKSVLRERIAAGHPSAAQPDSRRRLYNLPRNATVVEAIEQGLERFGITEGVVDGGDDVEDRTNNRRSLARIKYTLAAVVDGQERALAPSSKVIDAYTSPPALKPVERAPENRRRSRDLSTSSLADIQPFDPVFVLRRVRPRPESGGPLQRQQAQPPVIAASSEGTPLSPQEIIAAQRAATRASQRALISANSSQGVDVVVPDRGTLRSSRELHPTAGEVVRYSYIDGDGETYDISELLEEEWGRDGQRSSPSITQPPTLQRTTTDSSTYVTAPSTPAESPDILRGVLDRSAGQPEGKLEEKLERVIDKVKSRSPEDVQSGRQTPVSEPRHRADEERLMDEETPRPASRTLSTVVDGRAADGRDSRQADYHETAATVRRIISRHQQQPSIASIMSDLSGPLGHEHGHEHEHEHEHDDDGASTPLTATSSSHPTPPFSGAVYLRSVSAASPTPRAPVQYQDDFGMKALMAIVEARAKEYKKPPQSPRVAVDPVQKMFWGERADEPGLHPDIKACFAPVQVRLDALDSEIDELLAMLAAR